MVNVSIDVTDLGGEARPGDKVVFWRPRMGGSATHAGRVISTAPVTVFLTDGKATVSNVEPGEMTVLLQCRGVESQGPVTVGVPDGDHTVTLRALLESQFEYAPPIVSAVQEAASNASASEEAAIQAQIRSEAAADRADAKVDDAINNGANLVRNEVKQDADRAVSARQAAAQSESNAAASESAAASSASSAATSETNAKQSETNAGDYAAVATTAATEAVDAMERATDLAGGDFATHEYVDAALTIVAEGGMFFTADDFTPTSELPTYSETPVIPLRGMKYVYVRGSTQETTESRPTPLITGYREDGTSQVIYNSWTATFGGNKVSLLADLFSIPDEYKEVKVRLYNASHARYQADLPPMVMVALSPESVANYLESAQGYEHNTTFPRVGHARTGAATYNTGRLLAYPGMRVEYQVDALGEAGVIQEWGKDIEIISATTGTLTLDRFGVLSLSTFNSGHANYRPDFYAYYAATKTAGSEELATPTLGEYLPTPTLKAVRHANFLDGTSKAAIQYLWVDQHNNFYVSSTLRGDKKKIFTFKPSDFGGTTPANWSMGFDKFGNILCAFRTEQLSWAVQSDDLRRNPILLVRDQGYKPVVIDFGENLKPSNWLQDSGFLATDDYVMITEYTRPNMETANTWRATYPISDPANWQVVQSWPVVEPFKHIHNVDRDPYTGHIYTSTGDVDAAAGIYASQDGGNTFTTILDGSEKYCRVLNFVFTKDWIYWATDSSGANHWLFRAPRAADGVMDTENIEDVIQFPSDSHPTYATIHLPKIDALLFLNRADSNTTTLPVDLWDLRASRMIRLDSIPAVGGVPAPIGFRCEAFTYVPRGNEVAVGFSNTTGTGGYRSYLGLLGNTTSGSAKIQNLIMTVERIQGVEGDDFTISYDTSVF